MTKGQWGYTIIGILAVVWLVTLQYNRPKKLNWFPSYATHHKIPYGTYVLNMLMERMFPDNLARVDRPPYEFLTQNPSVQGTYFFVNGDIAFDDAELETLMDWVSRGNTLFIATEDLGTNITDSLGLKTEPLLLDLGKWENVEHRLMDPDLSTNGFSFDRGWYPKYFTDWDCTTTTGLGTLTARQQGKNDPASHPEIVKVMVGSGTFVISLFPQAFTNYFILNGQNRDYTAGLLSYMDPNKTVYMDEYYKSGKVRHTSPMHVLLGSRDFKWAYYLVLIGAVLYIVFEGRRKQRAIPVIPPVKNQTLAFTTTIAELYRDKQGQHQVVSYLENGLLDFIRTRYHLDTRHIDPGFVHHLAQRSGYPEKDLNNLFAYLKTVREAAHPNDGQLRQLDALITQFKKHIYGK